MFNHKDSAPKRSPTWPPVVMSWIAITLLFVILHKASEWAVLSEVRNHARGVAIAVASILEAKELDSIQRPEDQQLDLYRRIQRQLDRAVSQNPDIYAIYTMRRSKVPFAPSAAYEYVVDQTAQDRNRSGDIGADEQSVEPGRPYDASAHPAMLEAWENPAADARISSDPPFPDSISGYAPVRGSDGQTVAIVGVDVVASAFHQKMSILRSILLVFWLLMGGLAHLVVVLYKGQESSREVVRARNRELSARNELLRRALAAPPAPPVNMEPQLFFDRYDVVAASAGGGLFRVFELDQDRVGFLLADLQPGSSGAALLASATSLLIEHVAVPAGETMSAILPYADPFRPSAMLRVLGHLLAEELPPGDSASLLYGLLDFRQDQWTCASLGCPPVLVVGKGRLQPLVAGKNAPALRAGEPVEPGEQSDAFASGDALVLSGPAPGPASVWVDEVRDAAERLPELDPVVFLTRLPRRLSAVLLIR